MRCPRCTFYLSVLDHQGVELDHCPRCRGTFLDPGETTALFGAAMEPEAWTEAWPTEDLGPTRLKCPKDGDRLAGHRVSFAKVQVEVDTCPKCKGLWVDANEARTLKVIIDAAQNEAARKSQGLDRPGLGSYLFQIFTGMPVEAWNPVRTRPVIMHTVFGALILFFVMQVVFREGINEEPGLLMLVPAEVMHGHHLWTLVSAAFLHGGLAHLLGNLYFLWVFGDNVEDALGPGRFVALYAVALLAGALLHLVTNADSHLPMLGASGAIAGIMGAYMVLFPRVRVYVMLLVFRINIGVIWYLGFWIAMQFAMVALGGEGVAWMAHIGGFMAGAAMAVAFKKSARYSALVTPTRVGAAA